MFGLCRRKIAKDYAILKTILSLCDFSGVWSRPYAAAGYHVIQVDLKLNTDVRFFMDIGPVHGILAAPPCTAFAVSGAQYWTQKDLDGRTLEGLSIVDACMRIIMVAKPRWWALENPVGRLRRWLGPPAFTFHPYHFGDPYTKKTLLWGTFTPPTPVTLGRDWSVEPEQVCKQGSWVQRLGGLRRTTPAGLANNERIKGLRSMTPPGFAQAFFEVNP